MRLLVNHAGQNMQDKIYLMQDNMQDNMQDKIYLNIYFIHKSVEGQLKHWKNLIYDIYFM